jgi:hypothetical protein
MRGRAAVWTVRVRNPDSGSDQRDLVEPYLSPPQPGGSVAVTWFLDILRIGGELDAAVWGRQLRGGAAATS